MNADPSQRTKPTWSRFVRTVRGFTHSEVRGKALGLFLALIALLLGINGLNVLISYVTRDFMSAIEQRQAHAYLGWALKLVGVFGASTVAAVICRFCEERLGLLWRQWQTQQLVRAYMQHRCYLHLHEEGGVANPDEKISDDVKAFTTMTLSFVLMILNGTFTTVAFSGVLWSISPALFGVAVVYAALGTFFTIKLGRPMIDLNYTQLDKEANFRAELLRVRENTVPIALQPDGLRIRQRLLTRLGELTANYRRLIAVNRNLGFFTTGYNYLIQIIPPLLIAPLFISGKVEFGVIAQSAIAFSALLAAFSLIVTQFQTLSNYTAVIERIGTLVEAMENAAQRESSSVAIAEEAGRVAYENLTLYSPDGTTVLVKNLNASFPKGTRVLIGGSDAAKMALFRVTAGMWYTGEGKVIRPGADDIMFVPETPFLHPSTLHEAIVAQQCDGKTSQERIGAVLLGLGLKPLIDQVGGFDTEQTWGESVSLGNLQLLVIARVLLSNPEFAMLDRISTALSSEQVACVLRKLTENNITYFIMSGEGDRLDLYDVTLDISEDGSWALHKIGNVAGEKNRPKLGAVSPA